MGSTFANIAVRTASREKIVEFLKKKRHRAYVSPVHGKWLIIYDRKHEDSPDHGYELAENISKKFQTTVFVFSVVDSDFFFYTLLYHGVCYDQYVNRADKYFAQIPVKNIPAKIRTKEKFTKRFKGNEQAIIKFAIMSPTALFVNIRSKKNFMLKRKIHSVLSRKQTFAEDGLRALAELLGIKKDYCSDGYEYLSDDGKEAMGAAFNTFIHVKGPCKN